MISLFLVFAVATSAPNALTQRQLEPWAIFVGHCWRAELPKDGTTDTHCFEAVYGGQHVRDRHQVQRDGKTVYAGETVYSVEDGAVSFTYWNSLGGVGRGTAVAEGEQLRFAMQMRFTPKEPVRPMNPTWRKTADGYEVIGKPGAAPQLYRRVD